MMWQGILIGIVIWQAITIIVMFSTDDENKTAICGTGLEFVLCCSGAALYNRICLWYFHNNYNIYQIFNYGKASPFTYAIHKDVIPFLYIKDDNHTPGYVEFYRSGKDVKYIPKSRITLNHVPEELKNGCYSLKACVRPYSAFYKKC